MGNLDINPISSTFNPISTNGEGKDKKDITKKVLQLALNAML